MPTDDFKCKQCGHCCLDLNAFATCAALVARYRPPERGRVGSRERATRAVDE